MERPKTIPELPRREVTGEIVYLDELRRTHQPFDTPYSELSDMAIQNYEAAADMYRAGGMRPDIMNEYDQHDREPLQVQADFMALTDELLKCKEPDSPLTFVDIIVQGDREQLMARLERLKVAGILAGDDEQLAIESDGSYYPKLDIRKANAQFAGMSVRAWGWNDQKYVFTHSEDEAYVPDKHCLIYPSDEKIRSRQLDIALTYRHPSGQFTETLEIRGHDRGANLPSISSGIWTSAYAESGYEGHGGKGFHDTPEVEEQALGELMDFIAATVGDEPISVGEAQRRVLHHMEETADTAGYGWVIRDLAEATWPAQATYLARRRVEALGGKSIFSALQDPGLAEKAVAYAQELVAKYTKDN